MSQHENLPHLQSIAVVFWKLVFSHVSHLVAQNGRDGLQNGTAFPEDGSNEAQGKRRVNPSFSANTNGMANGQLAENEDGTDPVVEELNALRSREITTKAVSGVLLILLKWFKLSREDFRVSFWSLQRFLTTAQTFSNTNI